MKLSQVTTLFALSLLVAAGCKKSEDKGTPDRPQPQEPTSGKTAEKAEKTDKSSDQPPGPVTMPSVGVVTVEQAFATMGKSAPHRLEIRMPSMVQAGLVELAMSAMPAEDRTKYDSFVTASGFNPVTSVSGALIYAQSALDDFKTSRPTMIFGITGGITKKLIDELDKLDDDDDDDDNDNEMMQVVILAELTNDVRARLKEEFVKTKPGEPTVETEDVGDAMILAMREDGMTKYGYLWNGGIVFGLTPEQKKPALQHAREALVPLLLELAKAQAAKPATAGPAITGRGSANGTSAQFSINVGAAVTMEATATPKAKDLGKLKQVVAALPQLKSKPEMILGDVPPPAAQLTTLALKGTTARLEGGVLKLNMSMDTAKLKAAIKPLIDDAKK